MGTFVSFIQITAIYLSERKLCRNIYNEHSPHFERISQRCCSMHTPQILASDQDRAWTWFLEESYPFLSLWSVLWFVRSSPTRANATRIFLKTKSSKRLRKTKAVSTRKLVKCKCTKGNYRLKVWAREGTYERTNTQSAHEQHGSSYRSSSRFSLYVCYFSPWNGL